MIDEVEGGWDDPEVMGRLDGLDELDSGDTWTWVPPWSRQNAYGADRRLWGDGRPPVTQRLAESLGSYELAHFRGEVSWDYLRYRADRVMHRRSAHGFTSEDVVTEVLIDMEQVAVREGYLPGDREWLKTAEVVLKRRVTDLLRAQGGRKDRDVRYGERQAKFYGEYVALRGSKWYEHTDPEDEPSDHDPLSNVESEGYVPTRLPAHVWLWLEMTCSERERELVRLVYERGFSFDECATLTDTTYDAVAKMHSRITERLRNGANVNNSTICPTY